MKKNISVIGASGAIGRAFTDYLSSVFPDARVRAFSRQPFQLSMPNVECHTMDYHCEDSIRSCAEVASLEAPLDLVLVATGMLHEENLRPEKSLRELSAEKFQRLFAANTIVPALVAKYFLPRLNRDTPSLFATLSARLGSISDNQMGGWYSYRMSKAALNMFIKNSAIEIGKRNKNAIVVGLYPGMVDSALSKPYQKGVPECNIFSPKVAVQNMAAVLESLTTEQTGRCFDWDGQEILP
jgi:NAD(P)-dependent dehydrogenase (short-subunit alcohol dehydrogenase family)